jgi:hypothetical protein
MAKRPIFIPKQEDIGVNIINFEFTWFSGMSIQQKQKSIEDLHKQAYKMGYKNILEISSKSKYDIGIALSAFNLKTTSLKKNIEFTVETAYQSSKVFDNGGPYTDLLYMSSKEAKKDLRIRNSGNIIGFEFFGYKFPSYPLTLFYDWLYINVLLKNDKLCNEIEKYDGFSDIEFNPKKSINCQAFSAALFVSMSKNKIDYSGIQDPKKYRSLTEKIYKNVYQQNLI